jgi:AhpD family alkylhydroperoxidase
MTWLAGTAPDASIGDLLAMSPAMHERLVKLERDIWASPAVDPALLELVRLRVATLVGCAAELAHRTPEARAAGLTDEKIADLPNWPTSYLYTARERMVLAFAESYVIDAHSVTDELCKRLNEQWAPTQLSALTFALAVFDAKARMRTALGA